MAAPLIDSTHVLINALDDQTELADAAVDVTGNASIITAYDRFDAAGYGWLPTQTGIRISATASGTNTLAGTILNDANEFGPINGSAAAASGKRLFYTHLYSSTGSALNAVADVGANGYGYMFWLFSDATDRTANCRGWCVGGRDSIPTLFAPTPTSFICVDPTYTGTEVETGTSAPRLRHIDVTGGGAFDPTDIVCAAFTYLDGTTYSGTISRFGYYDAYTIYSGEVLEPGTFRVLYDKVLTEFLYAMAVGDGEQYRARMAIEIGAATVDGTTPTYFKVVNGSINFATRPSSLVDPLVRPFHGPDNKLGLEEAVLSGDIVIFTNYQLSSGTPWHFRFDSAVGADVQFNNCVIQNAGGTANDCEINSDVVIDGGLIDQCGKFSVNGGTVKNLNVTNPASVKALDITESSTLENLNFSTETDEDNAIEIPDPGGTTDNYTFDNLKFDGFDFDVKVLGSTGTVNINIEGGGDTPTVDSGTRTPDTPALLGGGWVAGTSYTAVAGGGDTKRCIFVVVSNDGSKAATGCTFGGTAMTLAGSDVEGTIGVALFYLIETGHTSVYTGAQTIAGVYSGGSPTNITYQAATYDHIFQAKAFRAFASPTVVDTVKVLDTWQSAAEISSSPTFAISSGTNRCLVVVVNHENNSGGPGATAVTWGGQSLTEQVEITSDTGSEQFNSSAIWMLNEAGIAAGSGTTLAITVSGGDNPSYGAATFEDVDQSPLPSDSDTARAANPSISTLSLTHGDMVVGSFTSTSGNNTSGWSGNLLYPDEAFGDNLGDDPSEGAYKIYEGDGTSVGTAGAVGGASLRSSFCVVVLSAASADAGNLDVDVTTLDEDLVIAAMQMSEVVGTVVWDGDATKRLETDRSNETVSVADYVEVADGSANMGFTNTSATGGVVAQLIAASFKPSYVVTSSPTVNVNNTVTVTITVKDASTKVVIEGAMVLLEEDPGGTDIIKTTTNASGIVTTSYNYITDQAVIGVARKGTSVVRYKESSIEGTITTAGFDLTLFLVSDE